MGDVVKLPTAAPRKVVNTRYVAQLWAAKRMREAWPGEYIPPHERRRQQEEARRPKLTRSPELALILATLLAMPLDELRRVSAGLNILELSGAGQDDIAAARHVLTVAMDQREAAEVLANSRPPGPAPA